MGGVGNAGGWTAAGAWLLHPLSYLLGSLRGALQAAGARSGALAESAPPSHLSAWGRLGLKLRLAS